MISNNNNFIVILNFTLGIYGIGYLVIYNYANVFKTIKLALLFHYLRVFSKPFCMQITYNHAYNSSFLGPFILIFLVSK